MKMIKLDEIFEDQMKLIKLDENFSDYRKNSINRPGGIHFFSTDNF